MGCLSDLTGGFGGGAGNNAEAFRKAASKLPQRKSLITYQVPKGYFFNSMKKIEGFDYVYFLGYNTRQRTDKILVILETHNMQTKYQTNVLDNADVIFPKKTKWKYLFRLVIIFQGSIITLKLTKDNITEESRIPNLTTLEQDNQNFRDLLAKGTNCFQFENGNTLWLLKKGGDSKILTIKDKNDKEIKKINILRFRLKIKKPKMVLLLFIPFLIWIK